MPETIDMNTTVFAKTTVGQQEIQDRSLNLSPLVRRTLVLIDGKRSGAELSVFLVGKGDIEAVLALLLEAGCIEAVGRVKSAPAPSAASRSAPPSGEQLAVDGLPPADVALLARITRRSCEELALAPGMRVHAQVKGVALMR